MPAPISTQGAHLQKPEMENCEMDDGSSVSLAIFGGRGAGTILAETARRQAEASRGQRITIVGFLNDFEPKGSMIDGYPVIGRFEDWSSLNGQTYFAASLHKAEAMAARIDRIESLSIPQARWLSVIDPTAAVARSVSYGAAFFACAGVQVLPSTIIGCHVALRSGVVIAHDCVLEDFVYVGANAVVAGYSRLRRGAYIAPGALIREKVTVGRMATVGLGAVVLRDVPDGATVVGNPARVIRHMT